MKNETYTYGMRLRGFSIGAQPMKGILYAEDGVDKIEVNGKFYHSVLHYSRKLTQKELDDYELDDLNQEE